MLHSVQLFEVRKCEEYKEGNMGKEFLVVNKFTEISIWNFGIFNFRTSPYTGGWGHKSPVILVSATLKKCQHKFDSILLTFQCTETGSAKDKVKMLYFLHMELFGPKK